MTDQLISCVMVGDEALVAQCVDIATAAGLDVVLVSTTNELVAQAAAEGGIPVVGPGAELLDGLATHPADVLFSIANLRVLPDAVLAQVGSAINFHDGPLPGYAGLNVTTWALLAGETAHAITWHLMTSDVDGGAVVTTEEFPIEPDDTSFSLNARCYEAALASFPRVAAGVAGGALTTSPQPHGTHRMFKRHDRPAELFDPWRPSVEMARVVRALDLGHRMRNPVGVVRMVLGGDEYVVDAATVAEASSGAPPGRLVSIDRDGARIATSDGDIVIAALSMPEGDPVDVSDAFAGHGLAPGDTVPTPDPALVDALRELEPVLAATSGSRSTVWSTTSRRRSRATRVPGGTSASSTWMRQWTPRTRSPRWSRGRPGSVAHRPSRSR